MADVRFVASGTPVVGDFASSTGSPLVIDISTGNLYALTTGDVVTLVGSVAGGSSYTLATQAFGKHVVPQPVDLGNAETHLSNRVLDRQVIPPQAVLGDSQAMLADRVFMPKFQRPIWT